MKHYSAKPLAEEQCDDYSRIMCRNVWCRMKKATEYVVMQVNYLWFYKLVLFHTLNGYISRGVAEDLTIAGDSIAIT